LKMNWTTVRDRGRIAKQGSEGAGDSALPIFLQAPKARPGKAALRAELAAAQAKITRTIKCPCGHEGTVMVPPAKANARLRCSRCDEVANERQ